MNPFDRWRQRHLRPWKLETGTPELRVVLIDRSPDLCAAWADAFAERAGVRVLEGDLLALSCDAAVSPANSFADMGGGIDQALDAHYAGRAQPRVREAIARDYLGELPVGAALITRYPVRRLRFLVTAPTMRIPGDVRGSINAYLAMRAALVAILKHNRDSPTDRIASVAIPGLGTGVGRLAYEEAATHMRLAYDTVVGGGWRRVVHPMQAPLPLGRAR